MPAAPLKVDALDGEHIDWRRVHPRYPRYQLLGELIGLAVTAAIFAAVYWFLQILLPQMAPQLAAGEPFQVGRVLVLGLFVALLVLIPVINITLIFRRYRALGYAERAEDFMVRRGVLFHKIQATPYGRIQSAEVTSGPIERAFGLWSLHLRTAGTHSSIHLPGLDKPTADRLREELVARGQAKLAGL